jgi:D-lactate dehydrogenase
MDATVDKAATETAKPKIVIYDAKPEDEAYFAGALPGFEVVTTPDHITPETLALADGAVAVAMHVCCRVDAKVMDAVPTLKLVAARSTGFDNVDVAEAARRGVAVVTVPSYGEHTVAEYAFLLMLAVSRKLPATLNATRAGEIHADDLIGFDLNGKTLGVVGTGHIGRHVIEIGRGFGMTVVGFDPFPNPELAADPNFKYLPLPELLAASDVVTLHAPATADNAHIIDAAALKLMKPTAILVNDARGSLVDTAALVEALTTGVIAGAGLDCLEGEQFENTDQELNLLRHRSHSEELRQALCIDILLGLPNVVLTSHNAFNSAEALQRIRETTAQNITAWQSGAPVNLVK